ncbi:hypothetical protein GYMLUDRAFT_139795, partial [Collybiopsis luxurians FD-317 M1]
LSTLAPTSLRVSASQVRFDTAYDDPSRSLATVACSDGPNGLMTKGYTTFNSLPSFPNIGAASAVTGWNSPECGTCWQLTSSDGKTINILAIDHTNNDNINNSGDGDAFVVSREAMDTLTGGNAVAVGTADVTSTQVARSLCGL